MSEELKPHQIRAVQTEATHADLEAADSFHNGWQWRSDMEKMEQRYLYREMRLTALMERWDVEKEIAGSDRERDIEGTLDKCITELRNAINTQP